MRASSSTAPASRAASAARCTSRALEAGERPMDWKPNVCWQLPLRLDDHTDDNGYVTSTLREWKRRDWGAGRRTSSTGGAPSRRRVRRRASRCIVYLRDEIIEHGRPGGLRPDGASCSTPAVDPAPPPRRQRADDACALAVWRTAGQRPGRAGDRRRCERRQSRVRRRRWLSSIGWRTFLFALRRSSRPR